MNIKSQDSHSIAHRILIVEDDPEVSQAVAEMVRHLGYTPCTCKHAEEALRFLASERVDLMLIDYRMPDLTGLDLILMLREDNFSVPIIMMTGYAETASRLSGEKLKEFTILKKPITLPILAKAVEKSLGLISPTPTSV